MKKIYFLCITLFMWSGSAYADELSKEAKTLKYKVTSVRARLPDSICKKPITSNNKSSALRVQKDLKWEGAPKLAELLKAVPEKERTDPKLKKSVERAEAFLACLNHIEKGLIAEKKDTEITVGFMKASDGTERTLEKLHLFANNENVTMWTSDPKVMQKWKDDLEKIHQLCTGKFKGIEKIPSGAMNPVYNHVTRCRVAAKRAIVMKKLAGNLIAKEVSMIVENFDKEIKTFQAHNGYLRIDSATELTAFYKPEEMKKDFMKRIGPILKIAEMSNGNAWNKFDKVHAKLWQTIRDAGKTWKAPKKEGSEKTANRAAKKRFKGERISKVYTTRRAWKVHKNSRGDILERTKVGYIIYKVKSDKSLAGPLCRAQSFTYAEKYVKKRFKKSNEISELGYTRFESCK